MNIRVKRIALTGILAACALLSFLLESVLPPLFLPGAKLGLSNIFSVIALIVLTPVDAVIILVVRVTLGCLIVGNPIAIIYALAGGLVSLFVMTVLIYFVKRVSVVCASVAGGVVHNIVQTVVFSAVTGSPYMLNLLPYYVLLGVLSGAVVGFIVYFLVKKTKVWRDFFIATEER